MQVHCLKTKFKHVFFFLNYTPKTNYSSETKASYQQACGDQLEDSITVLWEAELDI